jgi:predicted  nucleic acid-binding Zn-ribbon protein
MAKKKTARSIDELKKEYDHLHKQQIQAQTKLDNANEQLAKLEAAAKEEFGSSDIAELEAKLAAMEVDNEKRRSEYQTLLDKISADLAKVESGESVDTEIVASEVTKAVGESAGSGETFVSTSEADDE